MSDFIPNMLTPLPTVVPGPDGTMCVHPAIFSELIAFDDAVKGILLFFVLGIIIGAVCTYWSTHREEED